MFDDGELVGGLALQRSTKAGVEVLQFLGTGPLEPDHLDLVAALGTAWPTSWPRSRVWLTAADRLVDLVGARPAAWVLDAVPGRGEVTDL